MKALKQSRVGDGYFGNAPMKSSFKSAHQARKVTCSRCGGVFDRVFYERLHKKICDAKA